MTGLPRLHKIAIWDASECKRGGDNGGFSVNAAAPQLPFPPKIPIFVPVTLTYHAHRNHRRKIQGRPHRQPPRNLHGQRPAERDGPRLAGHRRGLDAPRAGLLRRRRAKFQRLSRVLLGMRRVPRDGHRIPVGQGLGKIPGFPLLILPGRAGVRRHGRPYHRQHPEGPQAQRATS